MAMQPRHSCVIWKQPPQWRVALSAIALLAALDGLPARAAGIGAFAVGACDRLGYATGYDSRDAAQASAIDACAGNGDKSCRVVAFIQGNCAAFAVSGRCGARGWADAAERREAEQAAIARCSLRGGHACTIRHSMCDGEE